MINLRKPIKARKLAKWLRSRGWRRLRRKGSHVMWESPDGIRLSIPARKDPIGHPYLRQIRQAIEDGEVQSRARRSSEGSDTADPHKS